MNPRENFDSKAPWIMALLMRDFPFGLMDAAAACGNGGHESNGLQNGINEAKPTVAGSRGGFGWFQWTGSRRRAFEAYCSRNGLAVIADKAQYGWLFIELKGTEAGAVRRTMAAKTLEAKVEAFELGFERAGVKHYPSRLLWAQRALEAWHTASDFDKTPPWERSEAIPAPTPRPIPETAPVSPPVTPDLPNTDAFGNVITLPTPADHPTQGTSPVEKVIGAGKGSAAGVAGGFTFAGALVYLAGVYGMIPPGTDGAMFGLAVGALVTGVTTGISAMIGTYRAKRNAD